MIFSLYPLIASIAHLLLLFKVHLSMVMFLDNFIFISAPCGTSAFSEEEEFFIIKFLKLILILRMKLNFRICNYLLNKNLDFYRVIN